VGTGIMSVTSTPDGASVYLDGHLATATNTTIPQLTPKTYQVKIVKEGFIPWEKEIKITEGLVTEVKVSLFPAIPTTYPLTFSGVTNLVLSPDGQKLAFSAPLTEDPQARQKGGVWVWTMSSAPISFNRSSEPHQLVASTTAFDFSASTLQWSPDSKQVLVTLQQGGVAGEANQRNFILGVDQRTSVADIKDITPTVASTLTGWEEDQKLKNSAAILSIADLGVRKTASEAASLKWSPDETKFIAGPKIFDLGLEKVAGGKTAPGVKVDSYDLPEALSYLWLPDSRHIILVQKDKIEICDFDGSNRAEIFAGIFDTKFVFPWPDSSRLVFVASHPTPTASIPNLFGINLK
jgi:dipeptidyl aminopeptidase/acylaminoacyl peptidase